MREVVNHDPIPRDTPVRLIVLDHLVRQGVLLELHRLRFAFRQSLCLFQAVNPALACYVLTPEEHYQQNVVLSWDSMDPFVVQ